ncbi:MAG: MerR family transcriptional regulator [Sphingobium sp.]|uniref:MerR family transcriptional regulator n=1 Tax=Sphingobium sp. TaxID=1912891 RepID=UPI0029BDF0CF|nr:MerR family transcriptional regulator [Sphingobium sp.]MDX3910719.1 MerR family transcriptional regulator [Sphingobium sp.]
MIVMKAEGAFLTIGELSAELGVPQHILRYWESRFPQLRPLQRSGNRRYYRPADVELARRIHRLLNVQGFTVRGAQKALVEGPGQGPAEVRALPVAVVPPPEEAATPAPQHSDQVALISRLEAIRNQLVSALG